MTDKTVVITLPAYGFDPTEAAGTWFTLKKANIDVQFATPHGNKAIPDEKMVTGEGLDLWGWIPGFKKLRLIGLILRANAEARKHLLLMLDDKAFNSPINYESIDVANIDGLVFPGGHDKRIRPFLESDILHKKIDAAFTRIKNKQHLPIAGICHGVLTIARSKQKNGLSVLSEKRITALPWDFENKAWQLNKIFRFWDPNYYRTYLEKQNEPTGYWSVEHEIRRFLKNSEQFILPDQSITNSAKKNSGMHRDSLNNALPAWVVVDGNLVTARWPGDVYTFASIFAEKVHHFRG